MAVIINEYCQEIAVCVEHNAGQIVRHFIAGKKQLPQDNIVLQKHEDCMELQPCVRRLEVMDGTRLCLYIYI